MSSRHLIMGTSGHVDHGKTALIRLLTGIDTDRLKEERERGISIELGFAHLDLPSGTRLGIVDVPGHERFVKHMLAGAGGIDFVLLVVAADEGVMPQTIEHGQILELLGVERGLVVLTKIDMVDPELAELAEEDVRDYLTGSAFEGWPIVHVSSVTGEGREAVIEAMETLAADVPERSTSGQPRLPIDRCFIMEGFGTVVTGTLWEGSFAEGDRVQIVPGGRAARIRQIQSHGEKVSVGTAGSRLALALHGVSRADIERGQWVVAAGAYPPASILDVRLRSVETEEKPLRQRQRVRFHLGAAEVYGRVTLFDGDALPPGESAVAQIRLEEPVLAARGDRFVIRRYSPIRTVGGGRVIEVGSRKRRRSDASAVAELEMRESGTLSDRILAALGGRPRQGLPAAEIAVQAGADAGEIGAELERLAAEGLVAALGNDRWVEAGWRDAIDALLIGAAEDYQARFPLRYGIQLGELRSRFQERLAPEAVDAAVAALAGAGRLWIRQERVRCGSAELELPVRERQAADAFKRALEDAGITVPLRATVEKLLAPARDPQELLAFLTTTGEIVRLTPDLYYTREQLARVEATVAAYFARQPTMTVADLKEMFGVSRKYAVPLLEYLDQRGITRRSGDDRVAGPRCGQATNEAG